MTTAPEIAKTRRSARITAALATATAAFGIIALGFTGGSIGMQADGPDCGDHNYCPAADRD